MVKGCDNLQVTAVFVTAGQPPDQLKQKDVGAIEARVCLKCARELKQGKHVDISMGAKYKG